MERKYYEAYEDRYRQIHGQNLQWFYSEPTAIVRQTIEKFGIKPNHKLLELGCGEGRDAFPLLLDSYDLLATDISEAAVAYCQTKQPEFAASFQVLDCVSGTLERKFDFIYAVAVVHMLVLDEDRNAFYTFIRNHLTPNGVALICTMGDGEMELQTDIQTAFDLQTRTHEQSGMEVRISATSCRIVNVSNFEAELRRNGLVILEMGQTSAEPDFSALMYAVLKKDK